MFLKYFSCMKSNTPLVKKCWNHSFFRYRITVSKWASISSSNIASGTYLEPTQIPIMELFSILNMLLYFLFPLNKRKKDLPSWGPEHFSKYQYDVESTIWGPLGVTLRTLTKHGFSTQILSLFFGFKHHLTNKPWQLNFLS